MSHDALIADAAAALLAKLARGGLRYADPLQAVVHSALRLNAERIERLLAYWLDADNRLLAIEELAVGATDGARFSKAHIARRAIAVDAHSAVIIHNHPSGAAEASPDDVDASDAIDRQLAAIGVLIAGHYVVSREGYSCIRTGRQGRWEDLGRKGDQPKPAEKPRCPHCLGLLEEDAT